MRSDHLDRTPTEPGPERDAMSWPPSAWERSPSGWRDDVWSGPESFLPYDALLELGPPPERSRPGFAYGAIFREAVETLVLTVLIFVGIRMVVQNFRIEGRSMFPTLEPNQYLLVNKLVYSGFGEPQRGDIIVFEAWGSDKDFIKRVIGVPGDEIHIHDGAVYVNDVHLDEPYLDQATSDTYGPITLETEQFFVLGDNRGNSSDSRTYGPLDGEKIVGKAWLTYWPPDAIGVIPDSNTSFASTASEP